jgi:hypothetical protein
LRESARSASGDDRFAEAAHCASHSMPETCRQVRPTRGRRAPRHAARLATPRTLAACLGCGVSPAKGHRSTAEDPGSQVDRHRR